MDSPWKQKDLGGGGLQSANLRLARLLKRRPIAYGLLLLCPFGAHRAYLEDRRGALLYCMGTGVTALCLFAGLPAVGWALGALLIVRALFDISWIEATLVRINKRLRVEVYMSQTPGAPAGYRGRFADEATCSEESAPKARTPSFAEQERQLREGAADRDRRQQ